MFLAQFHDTVRRSRLKRNMSQEKLARQIGISQEMLSRYETGSTLCPPEVAASLTVTLGLCIDSYCAECPACTIGRSRAHIREVI